MSILRAKISRDSPRFSSHKRSPSVVVAHSRRNDPDFHRCPIDSRIREEKYYPRSVRRPREQENKLPVMYDLSPLRTPSFSAPARPGFRDFFQRGSSATFTTHFRSHLATFNILRHLSVPAHLRTSPPRTPGGSLFREIQ